MDSAEPPVARSCASSPSSTLIVVAKEERTEPYSTQQFHPPSSSCSPTRRATTPSTSWSKYAPRAMTIPLMHGSTSPLKKGCPACSQRQLSLTSVTADAPGRNAGRPRGHAAARGCRPWPSRAGHCLRTGPVSRPVAGIGITPPRREQRPSLPQAVVALPGQQAGTPPLGGHARAAATTSAAHRQDRAIPAAGWRGRHPASSPARSWAKASKPPEETVVEWRVSRPGGVGLRGWPGTGQPHPSPPEPTGPAVTGVPYGPVR